MIRKKSPLHLEFQGCFSEVPFSAPEVELAVACCPAWRGSSAGVGVEVGVAVRVSVATLLIVGSAVAVPGPASLVVGVVGTSLVAGVTVGVPVGT